MMNGNKPWQKAIFENFLIVLSLVAMISTRIISKILEPNFGIYNVLAYLVAMIGFFLICYAKKDQLKNKKFFKFGIVSLNKDSKSYYQVGYLLLIVGLILSFLI